MNLEDITNAKLLNLDTETYNFLSLYIRNSIHKRAGLLEPELLDSIVQDSVIYLCRYYSEEKGTIKTYINYAILRSFQDYNRSRRLWNNKNIEVVNTVFINEKGEEYDNPFVPVTLNDDIFFDDNDWKYKLIAELLFKKYTKADGKNKNRAVYIRNRITWEEIEEMIYWKEQEIRSFVKDEMPKLRKVDKKNRKKKGYVKLSQKAKAESNYKRMIKQREYWKRKKLEIKEGNKKFTENN